MSIATLQEALEVNNPEPGDPVDVLAKVGGFEIGVIAGVVLGGAMMRRVVVLDVFIPARFFLWVQPSIHFPRITGNGVAVVPPDAKHMSKICAPSGTW